MLKKETYTYVFGFKDDISFSFFIEKRHVADVLELALYNAGFNVEVGTITGYIESVNLNTEEDLEKYDFYQEYVDNFTHDSHSRCNEELL